LENLFLAWNEFKRGKRKKLDVQHFEFNLEDNLFRLHQELKSKIYTHSQYIAFNVSDPKLRRIHKATVRDRVLHHAIFRILYSVFDKSFIFDSYSCRINKGTHRGIKKFEEFSRKARKNNKRRIFALKCDIRKFFDSVDQEILLNLIKRKIQDQNVIWLVEKIIRSFSKGLPLGNVTSQLFANIYLNELDQFAKHKLKIRYYLRYCDDFVILSDNEEYLKSLISKTSEFLKANLKLNLHPDKIIIRKFSQGVDFLGYVIFPHHKILRTKTKRRMMKKLSLNHKMLRDGLISEEEFNQSLQSYLGVLKHCEGWGIEQEIMKISE
jgi:retron-type reverse transcriptase